MIIKAIALVQMFLSSVLSFPEKHDCRINMLVFYQNIKGLLIFASEIDAEVAICKMYREKHNLTIF